MRIFPNLSASFISSFNRLMEKLEDPETILNSTYQQQVDMLRHVRRCIKEVDTLCERVKTKEALNNNDIKEVEKQVRNCLAQNKEDQAYTLLQRKQEILLQLPSLEELLASLQENKQKLGMAENKLFSSIQVLNTYREMIRAGHFTGSDRHEIKRLSSNSVIRAGDIRVILDKISENIMNTQKTLEIKNAENNLLVNGTTDELDQELKRITINNKAKQELEDLIIKLQGNPPAKYQGP